MKTGSFQVCIKKLTGHTLLCLVLRLSSKWSLINFGDEISLIEAGLPRFVVDLTSGLPEKTGTPQGVAARC